MTENAFKGSRGVIQDAIDFPPEQDRIDVWAEPEDYGRAVVLNLTAFPPELYERLQPLRGQLVEENPEAKAKARELIEAWNQARKTRNEERLKTFWASVDQVGRWEFNCIFDIERGFLEEGAFGQPRRKRELSPASMDALRNWWSARKHLYDRLLRGSAASQEKFRDGIRKAFMEVFPHRGGQAAFLLEPEEICWLGKAAENLLHFLIRQWANHVDMNQEVFNQIAKRDNPHGESVAPPAPPEVPPGLSDLRQLGPQ